MNRSNVNSRQQACYYLGVQENATQDEIKRAYHLLVKRYHPDSNPQYGAKEYYINVCEAYEYLMQNPYTDSKQVNCNTVFGQYGNSAHQRPSRIFQTNDQVKEQYRRQKMLEEERKKQQKRYAQNQQKKAEAKYERPVNNQVKSKEEEVLEKIRAIWLAETIKRQIALDREKKEAENKRKLYQAFMQQKMQEDKEK